MCVIDERGGHETKIYDEAWRGKFRSFEEGFYLENLSKPA